jgi:hypothetical protein
MLRMSRLFVAAVTATGLAVSAAPASAQTQEGLVNVAIEDVTVQVPISIAANICDLNVVALGELQDAGSACVATADSAANAGGGGGGNTAANAAAFEPVQIVPDIGLTLLDNDPTTTTGIPIVS